MADELATHATYESMNPDGTVWLVSYKGTEGRPDWTWRHIDLVNARARADVEHDPQLSPPIRHIVAGTDESPRIVADDTAVAGVLPSYSRTGVYDEFTVICWHFAATPTRLLSARRHAARSLAAAYHTCQGSNVTPADPIAIVHLALNDFCRSARSRMAVLDEELDAVEDRLLAFRQFGATGDLAPRIGQVRREAVEVRRALAPLARAMNEAEEEWPNWAVVGEHSSTQAAISGVLDDIAALNERARSLQDELTSRLADETNRRLYIVSVVTTLVMPATLVTGFFGMNTGGFPWGDDTAYGTVFAGLTCLGAVLMMVALLRWRRLL
jgi:zinc transporter